VRPTTRVWTSEITGPNVNEILEVEFEDGKRAIVPRANVEMIEG